MKKHLKYGLILFFLLLFVDGIHSQVNGSTTKLLFETKSEVFPDNDFAINEAIEKGKIKKCHSIHMDFEMLKDTNNFSFTIEGRAFHVENIKMLKHGNGYSSISGSLEGTKYTNVSITFKDKQVTGQIYTDNASYTIHTSLNGNYCLLELDEHDEFHLDPEKNETVKSKITTGDDKKNMALKSGEPDLLKEANSITPLALTAVNSCKLRVLILYTPAAASYFSNDILLHIYETVEEAKKYLKNSEVDEEWELAYAGLTNYTEAYVPGADSRYTDLNRFVANGDGYMDEVHDLRVKYSADVCLLLSDCTSDNQAQCGGVAEAWEAFSPDQAFCLAHVYKWGGLRHYTNSHEVSHLLGAGHDNYGPHSYGHGTINIHEDSVKTIMGTVWQTTIPFYSSPSPDLYYKGVPIGNASYRDNARVLRETIPDKVVFLQPENNVTIYPSDVTNMRFGEIISESSVATSGTIIIEDGNSLKIRTGEVDLNAGFELELGAEFEIINESVVDCP